MNCSILLPELIIAKIKFTNQLQKKPHKSHKINEFHFKDINLMK